MASDRLQSDVRKLLEKVRLVKTRVTVMREENIERDELKEHEDKKHAIIKGGTTPSTGILAIFLAIASGATLSTCTDSVSAMDGFRAVMV